METSSEIVLNLAEQLVVVGDTALEPFRLWKAEEERRTRWRRFIARLKALANGLHCHFHELRLAPPWLRQ